MHEARFTNVCKQYIVICNMLHLHPFVHILALSFAPSAVHIDFKVVFTIKCTHNLSIKYNVLINCRNNRKT